MGMETWRTPRDHEDREQGAASTNQGTPRMPANRQEPGEQRGTDSPTQACKGANPANTWDFGLQPLEASDG